MRKIEQTQETAKRIIDKDNSIEQKRKVNKNAERNTTPEYNKNMC